MIKISGLKKIFGNTVALAGIDLEIKAKEFFGLLGPNGAGKSTLMNILIGYLNADSGNVSINGKNINRENLEIRKSIGLVPQTIALYDDLSARENLQIFGSLFNLKKTDLLYRISEILNKVGLFERKNSLVKEFSGGMKRRLNLAASLLHNPSIILCDEPTVGIDPQSRNAIFDYLGQLNDEGKTIIYTTHYMEEAERLCSRIAIIDSGRIISTGTLGSLLNDLPYTQTITINKNQATESKKDLFKQFGKLIDENTHYELKPKDNLILSVFFKMLEVNGISYNSVDIKRPSLEAVFLHLTGRSLRD